MDVYASLYDFHTVAWDEFLGFTNVIYLCLQIFYTTFHVGEFCIWDLYKILSHSSFQYFAPLFDYFAFLEFSFPIIYYRVYLMSVHSCVSTATSSISITDGNKNSLNNSMFDNPNGRYKQVSVILLRVYNKL